MTLIQYEGRPAKMKVFEATARRVADRYIQRKAASKTRVNLIEKRQDFKPPKT